MDHTGEILLAVLAPVLLALGLWYFWPGTRRVLLPPPRQRAVPWTLLEIFAAYFLLRAFWPAVVQVLLDGTHFFNWLYGPDFPSLSKPPEVGLSPLQNARVGFWLAILSAPLTVVSIPLVFYRITGTRPYQLGLTWHRAARNVLLGVIAWVSFTPAIYGFFILFSRVYQYLTGLQPQEHPLSELRGLRPSDQVLLVLSAVIAAPLMEELFFRGVLQPWLTQQRWRSTGAAGVALLLALWLRADALQTAWKAAWATHQFLGLLDALAPVLFVVVLGAGLLLIEWRGRSPAVAAIYGSSLFFAAAHSFAWPLPVALFLLALVLGYLRHRTQSLVAPVVLHALFNAVASVALLLKQSGG